MYWNQERLDKRAQNIKELREFFQSHRDMPEDLERIILNRLIELKSEIDIDALADLIDDEKFHEAHAMLKKLRKKWGNNNSDLIRCGALLKFIEGS